MISRSNHAGVLCRGRGRCFGAPLAAILILISTIASAAHPGCDDGAANAGAAGADPACARSWIDHNLRLNDVQTIGTHNSYKQRIPADELLGFRSRDSHAAYSYEYGHRPIAEQLDRGVRQIELDVWDDPEGNRWLHPPGALGTGYPQPPWPADQIPLMSQPGFKVMHRADVDFRSSCATFVSCLTIVHTWSAAHPQHAPIMILMNAKDDALGPGSLAPLKFDTAAFDRLDAEVRSVFKPENLITPDDVQGSYPTLRDAVHANHWPTLEHARGRVFFVLDEDTDKVALYRGKRKNLEGRIMFVNADEHSPVAAYITLNDPVAQAARINAAVEANLLVRTRADADTLESRENDGVRRDSAIHGGAQYISTDYIEPNARFSAYEVHLPDSAIVRCNPHRNPSRCSGATIE